MRISIFGVGYVGAVSSACLAALGHAVVAVDVSADKVAMVNRAVPETREARLRMIRGGDNIGTLLERVAGTAPMDVAGTYRSAEYGADITFAETVGTMYAACSGELGEGTMVPLVPYATDTWLMPLDPVVPPRRHRRH